jgi:hypothetical protein
MAKKPRGEDEMEEIVRAETPAAAGGITPVTLERSGNPPTPDLALWAVIRKSTDHMSFSNYHRFLELVLCGHPRPDDWESMEPLKAADSEGVYDELRHRRFLPFNNADAYRLLKVATEAFVIVNCSVVPDLADARFSRFDQEDLLARVELEGSPQLSDLWNQYLRRVATPEAVVKTIVYLQLIREKLPDLPLIREIFRYDRNTEFDKTCYGILQRQLTRPCLLELIWSYWHEEGMLVQTMNAIGLRFQNIRGRRGHDPLAMLEIDSLRPLNNLIWGYIQDEQHRLSLLRRVYEYDHHYGLSLEGRAVPALRPADSRSQFLEAFHNLLYLCAIFFKEDDDTTVKADGFPVLNAVKDVHLLLTQGASNQFGDLPSTARQEMLVQQWLLARPEFREYLPTRIQVAYPEPWMDRVDAMKTIQGWSDASILHFHNLGIFGEQVLLSIRFGAWNTVNDPNQAANWARFWRAEIQGYYYAYQAVTGVDLTAEITSPQRATLRNLQPSVHLAKRLTKQGRAGALPEPGLPDGQVIPRGAAAGRRAIRGPIS